MKALRSLLALALLAGLGGGCGHPLAVASSGAGACAGLPDRRAANHHTP